ncbi:hypothetical protein B0H17DRAFT_1140457 [Mycena rosella]|uniref:Uncharacterized protein n=1 Tax=Mycena rosella TaxID=1033263 RepID=A0AAD7GA41_MYCRO|nr:hypothetical protein B0H17DRAFT_1140457 [Mycena rosella]
MRRRLFMRGAVSSSSPTSRLVKGVRVCMAVRVGVPAAVARGLGRGAKHRGELGGVVGVRGGVRSGAVGGEGVPCARGRRGRGGWAAARHGGSSLGWRWASQRQR